MLPCRPTEQLADSIGSVREVVARSLRELRDKQIVATGQNLVRVLDVERLEGFAQQVFERGGGA